MIFGHIRRKSYFLFFLFALFSFVANGAEKGLIEGIITDKASYEPMPGTSITVERTDIIVFSDESGKYSIEVPEGTYVLRAELLGFKPSQAENVVVLSGETITVNLKLEEAAAVMGEEYVVTGERLNVPLSKTTASVSVISSKDIDKIPSVDWKGIRDESREISKNLFSIENIWSGL